MRLALTITAELGRQYIPSIRKQLHAARALIDAPLRELSVALVNDRTMSQLHSRYMKRRGPTDVLTFPLALNARGISLAGEIVVCMPEARRRARIEQIPVRNELLLYVIHGLLHLAGYDDRTARGFQIMHQLEDKILTGLGVGSVFQKPDSLPRYAGGGQGRGLTNAPRRSKPSPEAYPRLLGEGEKHVHVSSTRRRA